MPSSRSSGSEPSISDEGDETLLQPDSARTVLRADHDGPPSAPSLARGTSVGRYIVLEELGSGGMGVVCGAYDPELDRRVAIKVLQAGQRDDSQATGGRARLLREAQAMAKLSHPNVVSVYDVGTFSRDDDATPLIFVAMEYIQGKTLKAWLAGRTAPDGECWRDIIEVFRAAGRGLAAAHDQGIVHRDFKPTNVMVDEDGRVKVLDFGLARPDRTRAKISHGAPAELGTDSFDAKLTQTGAILGTPYYMSPEQHLGEDSDARTDQFSFCVALYDALFAVRPFAGDSIHALAHSVLHGKIAEPPRDSLVPTRIRTAILRGLATDRDDRFPDMRGLVRELSWDPRARNRRVALGVGAAILATGGMATAWALAPSAALCRTADHPMSDVWNRERKRVIQTAFENAAPRDAEAFYTQVSQEMDAYAKAWSAARRDACVANRVHGEQSDELFELRLGCLDRRLHRVAATLDVLSDADETAVHRSLEMIGKFPDVSICADERVLRTDLPPPDDPEIQRSTEDVRGDLGRVEVLFATGRIDEAVELSDQLAVRARATQYRPVISEALTAKGQLMLLVGRTEEGAALYEEALIHAEASGHDVQIVTVLAGLVLLEAQVRSRFDVAHLHARRAEAVLERIEHDPIQRLQLRSHHATVFLLERNNEEAAQRFQTLRSEYAQLGLSRDPRALYILNKLGNALLALERFDEAEEIIVEATNVAEVRLGRRHPELAHTLATLARLRAAQDRHEESLDVLQRANEIYRIAFGPEHANVAATYNGMALELDVLGRPEEARERFVQALDVMSKAYGGRHMQVAIVLNNLGSLERRLDNYKSAIGYLERGMGIRSKLLQPDSEDRVFDLVFLGDTLLEAERLTEAEERFSEARERVERFRGPSDPAAAPALVGLGEIAWKRKDPASARTLYEGALRLLGAGEEPDTVIIARANLGLGLLSERSDPARARDLATTALASFEKAIADGNKFRHRERDASRALLRRLGS